MSTCDNRTAGSDAPTRSWSPPPALLFLVAAGAQQALPARGATGRSRAIGGAALVLAGLSAMGSIGAFVRRGTTVDPRPGARPSRLVTTGPNRLTRNPMYLSMSLALATHAVWRQSLLGALPAAAFITWMDRRQIPREEAVLEEEFGSGWARYARRTRRWV